MAVNPDFKDLLSALSVEDAEFMLVGAHAVMYYTAPRYTKDLDLWVRPTRENAERVWRALAAFGAPMDELSVDDLATPETIFQIGVEPNRIDVVTSIDGVSFETAWAHCSQITYGGVPVSVIGIRELMANKRKVGRPQDLIDLANLEKVKPEP